MCLVLFEYANIDNNDDLSGIIPTELCELRVSINIDETKIQDFPTDGPSTVPSKKPSATPSTRPSSVPSMMLGGNPS